MIFYTAECYTCTGPASICENLYTPKQCTSDEPYCINDVTNNADGTRTVNRRWGKIKINFYLLIYISGT